MTDDDTRWALQVHALTADMARMGAEQYDHGFDACVGVVEALAAGGLSALQICGALHHAQERRQPVDVVVTAVLATRAADGV